MGLVLTRHRRPVTRIRHAGGFFSNKPVSKLMLISENWSWGRCETRSSSSCCCCCCCSRWCCCSSPHHRLPFSAVPFVFTPKSVPKGLGGAVYILRTPVWLWSCPWNTISMSVGLVCGTVHTASVHTLVWPNRLCWLRVCPCEEARAWCCVQVLLVTFNVTLLQKVYLSLRRQIIITWLQFSKVISSNVLFYPANSPKLKKKIFSCLSYMSKKKSKKNKKKYGISDLKKRLKQSK